MKLRTLYIALSMVSNLALILATVASFVYYSTDAGIIVGGFALIALSVSNAVLSLHFKDDK